MKLNPNQNPLESLIEYQKTREKFLDDSKLSKDFREFNYQVGMPFSDITKQPVKELAPFQIELGGYRGKDLIINKANKVGATWTILREMAHKGVVGDCVGYNMMLTSSGGVLAIENLLRLQRMFESPALSGLVAEKKATRMSLKNGTRYLVAPATPSAMRSWERIKFIFADEAAHIGRLDDSEYVGAMTGRLANTDGYLRVVSTPKGQRGYFWRLWELAENHRIEMKYKRLPFDVGIGTFFTQEFIDKERGRLGKSLFEQEYECQFNLSSNAAIEAELVDNSQDDSIEPESW